MTTTTVHLYEALNYVNTDALPRDQTQSQRLHEPTSLVGTIDPISGCDIVKLKGQPFIQDGNMMMYFESDQTREQYRDTTLGHSLRLPDNPEGDGIAEG